MGAKRAVTAPKSRDAPASCLIRSRDAGGSSAAHGGRNRSMRPRGRGGGAGWLAVPAWLYSSMGPASLKALGTPGDRVLSATGPRVASVVTPRPPLQPPAPGRAPTVH